MWWVGAIFDRWKKQAKTNIIWVRKKNCGNLYNITFASLHVDQGVKRMVACRIEILYALPHHKLNTWVWAFLRDVYHSTRGRLCRNIWDRRVSLCTHGTWNTLDAKPHPTQLCSPLPPYHQAAGFLDTV